MRATKHTARRGPCRNTVRQSPTMTIAVNANESRQARKRTFTIFLLTCVLRTEQRPCLLVRPRKHWTSGRCEKVASAEICGALTRAPVLLPDTGAGTSTMRIADE